MKSFLTASIILMSTILLAQDGYNIEVHIPGMANDTIHLANYYGDKIYMKDTTVMDKRGKGTFTGDEKLLGGMYVIILSEDNYFEFVLGDEQHFQMSSDLNNLTAGMKIKGSEEASIFYNDIRFLAEQRKKMERLQARLKQHEGNKDSTSAIRAEMEALNQLVMTGRQKISEENPDLFYGKLIKAMNEPQVPNPPRDEAGNLIDSNFAYHYFKSHFWDDFDFSDDRFVNTPIFHQKLKKYMEQLTPRHPDSIIVSSDYLLERTRASDEQFKYTLIWLLNKFASDKVMGMDAVYVHLVENYYMKGDAPWVGKKQLEKIVRDAMLISPNLIGREAKNLVMQDENGNWHDLHKLDAEYTILYFWDADCGHCRKETPRLKKLYDKYGGDYDIAVYAVSVEHLTDKWEKFIEDHDLDWINVIDPDEETNFRRYYNIRATPSIYLLDKDKVIRAKGIDTDTLEDLLRREWGLEPIEREKKDKDKDKDEDLHDH